MRGGRGRGGGGREGGGFLEFDRFRVGAVKIISLSMCKIQYLIFADPVNHSIKLVFFEKRRDESVGFGKTWRRERSFLSQTL